MGTSANGTASLLDALSQDLEQVTESKDSCESGLLLEAFQMFTQASSSLETAFHQLQARTRRLSEELAAKNR